MFQLDFQNVLKFLSGQSKFASRITRAVARGAFDARGLAGNHKKGRVKKCNGIINIYLIYTSA
jgi:hypothetical protein